MGKRTVSYFLPHNTGTVGGGGFPCRRWLFPASASFSFATKTKAASGIPLAALQRPESVASKQTNDRRCLTQ